MSSISRNSLRAVSASPMGKHPPGPCTCPKNNGRSPAADIDQTGPPRRALHLPTHYSVAHAGLSASVRATGPHRKFNKYLGAPKTQPDVELRRGCRRIEIKQILSATSRETLFPGTVCLRRFIALVCYYRPRLSPTSDTHIGLLSPPFSASATSWRLLGHQQARLQIRVLCRP